MTTLQKCALLSNPLKLDSGIPCFVCCSKHFTHTVMLLSARLHQTPFASKRQDEKNPRRQRYDFFPPEASHAATVSLLNSEQCKHVVLSHKMSINIATLCTNTGIFATYKDWPSLHHNDSFVSCLLCLFTDIHFIFNNQKMLFCIFLCLKGASI